MEPTRGGMREAAEREKRKKLDVLKTIYEQLRHRIEQGRSVEIIVEPLPVQFEFFAEDAAKVALMPDPPEIDVTIRVRNRPEIDA